MNILIIGIDSLISKGLIKKLNGYNILGTSRRKRKENHIIYFDLSWEKKQWPKWPESIDIAFLAAGIVKQKTCEDNPQWTRFINEEQTLALIDSLQAKSIHVIFPSSDLVLKCNKNQSANSALHPIGVYAHLKSSVEKYISNNNKKATVLRLPKILDSKSGILKDWHDQLLRGKKIFAFKNVFLSPISLNYTTDIIKLIIETDSVAFCKYLGKGSFHTWNLLIFFLII